MSAGSGAVRLIARALPAHVRDRYREEWLADLSGAQDVGVPPVTVIMGAVATTAAIDRDHPDVIGMPQTTTTLRRTRWAAALLASAAVTLVGHWYFGLSAASAAPEALVSFAALARAGLFGGGIGMAVAGMIVGVRALRIGLRTYGWGAVFRTFVIGIGAVVCVLLALLYPIAGLLAVFGVFGSAAIALFLAAGGPRSQPPQRPLNARTRVGVSLAFSLGALAVGGFGMLHVFVWNPLARVPGLSLDEIYTEMAAAHEGTGAGLAIASVVALGVAALLFPVCCALPRFAGPRSTRRIIVTGSLLVAFAVASNWLFGFTMGMGLADTFFTSGSDAAVSGLVLALIGVLALVGAIFAGLVPAKWRALARAS